MNCNKNLSIVVPVLGVMNYWWVVIPWIGYEHHYMRECRFVRGATRKRGSDCSIGSFTELGNVDVVRFIKCEPIPKIFKTWIRYRDSWDPHMCLRLRIVDAFERISTCLTRIGIDTLDFSSGDILWMKRYMKKDFFIVFLDFRCAHSFVFDLFTLSTQFSCSIHK